jgi:hypothetical protein
MVNYADKTNKCIAARKLNIVKGNYDNKGNEQKLINNNFSVDYQFYDDKIKSMGTCHVTQHHVA